MAPSIKIIHASRRTKHIDVRNYLVRDAYDAGKVRVVCVSGRGLVH